jgi:phage-related protein
MAISTLSFEIDADMTGFDAGMAKVNQRLDAIERQLGSAGKEADKTKKTMEDMFKNVNTAFAVQAFKMVARAMKELAHFVFDAAKAAADAGSGPMKKFVANIDALHMAFQKVGAQAASQLAPVLQEITDKFTNSTEAAKGLKEAGNFIANVFRVVATVGIAVVAVFDAVGTAIAGVASMIVDVLSGNMQGAAEAWKMLGEEIDKTMTKAGERVAVVWQQGQDFTGEIGKAAKKPTGLTDVEKMQVAAARRDDEISEIEAAVKARKDEFDAIGDTEKQFKLATHGFENFNEALEASGAASKESARERVRAEELAIDGKFLEAEQAKMSADGWARSAEVAATAADAFQAHAEAQLTATGVMNVFANSVLQAIPRLNQLVSAAQQGAQVGGVWGALIAVLIQLISETEGFTQILDHVNGAIDKVLDVLEPLVSGFASFFDALSPATDAVMAIVKGPLETIGGLLESLTPLIESLTAPLKDVSKVLESLGSFGKTVMQPIFMILKLIGTLLKVIAPLLQILMLPLTLLGILFEEITKALEPAFKEIDKAISWLANRLDEFGDFVSTIGERIANFVKGKGFVSNADLNKATDAALAAAKGFETATHKSEEFEQAVTRDTAAIDAMSDAANAATEALTNVPSGVKLAQLRFASMSGEVPHMASGGVVTRPTFAMIGESGPEAVIPLDMLGGMMGGGGGGGGGFSVHIDNLTVVAPDPEAFWKELRRTIQRESFIRTGASVAAAPQWVGG